MNDENELKKYNTEIQIWINSQPETLYRLKKFYDSIVSIHLGGEGLMEKLSKTEGYKEKKKVYKDYKINYPNKMNYPNKKVD